MKRDPLEMGILASNAPALPKTSWPPNPAHSARFSISLISGLLLNLARKTFVLDSAAAISSGNSGPETCGMRRVQTQEWPETPCTALGVRVCGYPSPSTRDVGRSRIETPRGVSHSTHHSKLSQGFQGLLQIVSSAKTTVTLI